MNIKLKCVTNEHWIFSFFTLPTVQTGGLYCFIFALGDWSRNSNWLWWESRLGEDYFAIPARCRRAAVENPAFHPCGSWIYYGKSLLQHREITELPRRQSGFPSKGGAINIAWFTLKCTPVALKRAFSETDLQPNELFMNLLFPQRREGWKFMVNFMHALQLWSGCRSGVAAWFYAVLFLLKNKRWWKHENSCILSCVIPCVLFSIKGED